MKKRVILLADSQTEFSSDLIGILRSAGVIVSTCRLGGTVEFHHELNAAEPHEGSPMAIVCQIPGKDNETDLSRILLQTRELWPGIPIVASAGSVSSSGLKSKEQLTRIGFRAVADSPAQLPALLREVEENPSTEYGPEPCKSLPDQTALALPMSMRAQRLRDVFALIASLHFAANQKEAISIAITGIAQLVTANCWSIYVVDQKNTSPNIRLELVATYDGQIGFPSNTLSAATLRSGPAQEAVSKAQPIKKAVGENWVLALPLVNGDRAYGVLEAIRRRSWSRSFSKSEIALLAALTTPIAAALSNSVRIADAERLSQTDELTRLHNARYLRQFLVNEMKRARRFGSKIAALFLDLDDFKRVNDLHGHLAGSHVLMEIAAVILPSVRDTDCVVRYGGDEFVIILPETGLPEAVRVAHRILDKIGRHQFTGGRRLQIHLTASIGLAIFPDEALSPHQLIACADRAMYAAKAANKNCVRAASPVDFLAGEARIEEGALEGAQFQRIPDEKFIS